MTVMTHMGRIVKHNSPAASPSQDDDKYSMSIEQEHVLNQDMAARGNSRAARATQGMQSGPQQAPISDTPSQAPAGVGY